MLFAAVSLYRPGGGGILGLRAMPSLPPPGLQRDTAANNNSMGTLPRKSDCTNDVRPKNVVHLHHKYVSLALEEPEGGQANARTRVRGDDHGATMRTGEEGLRETGAYIETGQRALLARGMQEDGKKERSPPDQLRALNVCDHPGGEGAGGPLTQKNVPTARRQGAEGDPPTR